MVVASKLKTVNFLVISLGLNTGELQSYRKSSPQPLSINIKSEHVEVTPLHWYIVEAIRYPLCHSPLENILTNTAQK